MIVIDASAFLELLLRTPAGLQVEDRLRKERAVTVHLFDAEVLHRLVSFGKHGVLDPHDVETGVADLRDAPIARFDPRPLLERAAHFSAALSGYDALYAALADSLEATLLTGDRRLARTASRQLGLDAVAV